MRDQGEEIGLARLDPWRLAPDDEVRKGELFALGRGCLLGAVLPCDGPFGELALEIGMRRGARRPVVLSISNSVPGAGIARRKLSESGLYATAQLASSRMHSRSKGDRNGGIRECILRGGGVSSRQPETWCQVRVAREVSL